jgi:hypothetical protein
MDKKEQNAAITEAGMRGRGGYRDEKDFAESRKRSQRVRGEFLSPAFKAKATFAYDSVMFNTACVGIFSDDQYVAVNVDEPNLRIYIEPCGEGERDSLKFANRKNGRNKPRKCIARWLCEALYELMKWNTQAKYRTLAIPQMFFGRQIIVFNLDECLQVFTETFNENGTKKRKTTINMPLDWKGRFGYTPEEFESKRKIEETAEFIRIDNKTGERRGIFIQPTLPTPEQLMHRPYGGIRPRAGEDDE